MTDFNTPGGKARAASAMRGAGGQFLPAPQPSAHPAPAPASDSISSSNRSIHARSVSKTYVDLQRKQDRRQFIDSLKSLPCADCKVQYPPDVMQFDHVRGEKKFHLSSGIDHSEATIREEAAKCDVVCANCHWLRTSSRRVNPLRDRVIRPVPVVKLAMKDLPHEEAWWEALAVRYPNVNLHAELLKALDWHRAESVKSPKLFFRNWIERASLSAPSRVVELTPAQIRERLRVVS